jgi:hypothetical protein
MSVGKCHVCGTEYGIAPALAGQTFTCRKCGAKNDGAGGPARRPQQSSPAPPTLASTPPVPTKPPVPASPTAATPVSSRGNAASSGKPAAGSAPVLVPTGESPKPQEQTTAVDINPRRKTKRSGGRRDLFRAIGVIAIVGSLSAGVLVALNATRSPGRPSEPMPNDDSGPDEVADPAPEPATSSPSDNRLAQDPGEPESEDETESVGRKRLREIEAAHREGPPVASREPKNRQKVAKPRSADEEAVEQLASLRKAVAEVKPIKNSVGKSVYADEAWKSVIRAVGTALELDRQRKVSEPSMGGFIRLPGDDNSSDLSGAPLAGPVTSNPELLAAWSSFVLSTDGVLSQMWQKANVNVNKRSIQKLCQDEQGPNAAWISAFVAEDSPLRTRHVELLKAETGNGDPESEGDR